MCRLLALARQPYRALLSGACGHAVGSATVWHFGPGWEKALDREATRQMAHVKALLTALPWWRLVPDAKGELVVDGRGTPGKPDFAAAARTDDGSFAVVYLPTARAVMVDVSKLTGKRLKAWWFNPRDGKATAADAPAIGVRHQFRPPSDGAEDDWVLILHDADKPFVPRSVSAAPVGGQAATSTRPARVGPATNAKRRMRTSRPKTAWVTSSAR